MGYSDEDHLSKTHLYEVSDTDSGCFSNIVGQANFAQSLKRQLPTVFHFLIGGGGEFKIMISLIFNQSLSHTYLRAGSYHSSNFLLSKITTHIMLALIFCKMSYHNVWQAQVKYIVIIRGCHSVSVLQWWNYKNLRLKQVWCSLKGTASPYVRSWAVCIR